MGLIFIRLRTFIEVFCKNIFVFYLKREKIVVILANLSPVIPLSDFLVAFISLLFYFFLFINDLSLLIDDGFIIDFI